MCAVYKNTTSQHGSNENHIREFQFEYIICDCDPFVIMYSRRKKVLCTFLNFSVDVKRARMIKKIHLGDSVVI